MPEERKLVTILFADVVGSTAMAGDNDPEVVRGVMGRYFERLTEIAQRHGGTVEKFAGDSVMVVFGVPTVHDDDAERAVRAALASRDAVAEMAPRLPIALSIRVGVNSGEAVTDAREDRQFMVSGDPVNVAARLQQAAGAGEVLVGALTEALTRAAIEYEPATVIEARGKPDPVPAFRALRPRNEVPTQARGIPGLHASMVGRGRELRLLLDTFGRVVEDRRPHLFTLVGGGGVGKSRLVAEALANPALDGATVLRGRCLPYGSGITYWPLVEIFERRLPERAVAETEWPAVRARLSVLLGIETAAAAMPDVPAEMVNREIGWAVRRHLQALASVRPVIVVLDDLQWAEGPLVELVKNLTDRMADVPLLLLAIARPELLEAEPAWGAGKSNSTTLTLAPLDPAETADLISRLLDVDGLPDSLRQQVVERSEGTPLYCEEFLRMLIEEGRVVRTGGAWRASGEGGEIRVPHSIQALLAARLDGLGAGEKALLQAAAVIGERFRETDLGVLLGRASPAELDSAIGKGLLLEGDAEAEFRFRHLLLRDAAYASIPKTRRAELHERFAALLESQPGASEQLAEIIGHHAERSFSLSAEVLLPPSALVPRARQALHWALLLGDRALSRLETQALEGFLRTAQAAAAQLDDSGGPQTRARLAILDGRLLAARGDFQMARLAVATAADLAREADLGEVLAGALLTDMLIFTMAGEGTLDHLEVLLEDTVRACRAVNDLRSELEARATAAWRHWSAGRLQEYVDEIDGLLGRLAGPADEGLIATLLLRAAGAEWMMGASRRSVERLAAGEVIARRNGYVYLLARVEGARGNQALLGGDPRLAEAHYRRVLELAPDNEGAIVVGLRFIAYALEEQGRNAEAVDCLERAIEISETSGDRWHRSEVHSILARQLLILGNLGRAEELAEKSVALVREGDVTGMAEAMQALGRVRSAQGRWDEAEAAFERGVRSVAQTEFHWARVLIGMDFAEFLAARGRPEEVRHLLADLEPILSEAGWHIWDRRIDELKGRMPD